MKRQDLIWVTGLGAAGAATLAIAQSMPNIKWHMPMSWPKSLDTLHGGASKQAGQFVQDASRVYIPKYHRGLNARSDS